MLYKGFIINPVYYVGSDFSIGSDDSIKIKKPKSSDIEYYEVLDPMDNNSRYIVEFTIRECKLEIDRILKVLGLKDNTIESWNKINVDMIK